MPIGYTDNPRLSGRVGGVPNERMEEFTMNFVKRIDMRGKLKWQPNQN